MDVDIVVGVVLLIGFCIDRIVEVGEFDGKFVIGFLIWGGR